MIFISFSSKDIEVAKDVDAVFKQHHVNTWFAQTDVDVGDNYSKKITTAIKEASCVVLIFSNNANHSVHVPRELDLAAKYQKPIFPIRIQNDEPDEGLEYFLSTVQWFDAFNNSKQEVNDFVTKVLEKLGVLQDNRKFIDAQNIDEFCIQHFKLMGYKLARYGKKQWEEVGLVQAAIKKEPEKREPILEYLDKTDAIYATPKDGKQPVIIVPKYLEKSTTSYFKALEANYFYEAREIVFTSEYFDILKQEKKLDIEQASSDFKKRSQIVDYFRGLSFDLHVKYALLPILFYQYVKEPSKYKKTHYLLPFDGSYDDDEVMPNLYVNFTLQPNWQGVHKANIDKYYAEFTKSYEEILHTDKFRRISRKANEYEHYNGRLAEAMAEVFFNKNGLMVQRYGVEHTMGNALGMIKRTQKVETEEAKKVMTRFMSSPDLLVIKLDDENRILNSYFFDVKYRQFNSRKEFQQSLIENNDLYKHAKKYHINWDEVHLFLFAHFKNEQKTEVYVLNVGEISRGDLLKPQTLKKDTEFYWLEDSSVNELCKYANRVWN